MLAFNQKVVGRRKIQALSVGCPGPVMPRGLPLFFLLSLGGGFIETEQSDLTTAQRAQRSVLTWCTDLKSLGVDIYQITRRTATHHLHSCPWSVLEEASSELFVFLSYSV